MAEGSRNESKPLLVESTQQRSISDVNLPQMQQELRRSINLDELRSQQNTSTLAVPSTVRKYSDSYLNELLEDMQQAANVEHRYQKNQKLSHSRGIKLPTIKLEETIHRPRSINLGELKRDISPTLAASPVAYTLKHDTLLASDRLSHSESFTRHQNEANVLTLQIFLANGKAIQFEVEDGVEAMASDLLQLMAEHLNVDEEVVDQSLAIWLISPLFELQLKPYHVAYELFNKWPLFLRRFTTATEDEIAEDEPLLVIRRNVHLTVPLEIMYQNEFERLTEIFYYDAKDEYMSGRYLVDIPMCVKVAALQLAIENGPLEKNENSFDIVHDKLPEIVPEYLLTRVKSFHLFGLIECKSGLEKQIIREYKSISRQFTNNFDRRKAYLNVLRELPYYGASFFTATTDRKQTGSLVDMSKRLFANGQQQIELLIGINCEYITLIDKQKNELLLTRNIGDCSWFRTIESQNDDDEEIPSFFIHFPDDKALMQLEGSIATPTNEQQIPDDQLVSRLLQLFSKQASLIENLMNLFYEQSGSELGSTEELAGSPASSNNCPIGEASSPLSNGNSAQSTKSAVSKTSSLKSSDIPSPASSLQCCSKIHKLCTSVFDKNGKCVSSDGSLKRILLECH